MISIAGTGAARTDRAAVGVDMIRKSTRILGISAACWALPYIVSKIQFAIEGKLGIHGGPRVPASAYANFDGPAAVSTAQWGNVAVGTAFLLISLVPATGLATRLNRWVLATPILAMAALQLSTGIFMIARGIMTGIGGWPFGVYLLVWSALLVALAGSVLAGRRPSGTRRAR